MSFSRFAKNAAKLMIKGGKRLQSKRSKTIVFWVKYWLGFVKPTP
tara:strand:- start:380 stop:514 length:135 start_codon:yes stop_codon:yes gene_type:complete